MKTKDKIKYYINYMSELFMSTLLILFSFLGTFIFFCLFLFYQNIWLLLLSCVGIYSTIVYGYIYFKTIKNYMKGGK